MSTSGTYSFLVSANDIINSALRAGQIYGPLDPIPASVTTNAMLALNIMTKAMCMKGLPLWAVEQYTVPQVEGVYQYTFSQTSTTQPRPLKILDAFLTNGSGNDVSLTIESRYDWDTLGSKTQTGVTNQLWYDYQLGTSTVTCYATPPDNTYTLQLVVQRPFMDFNLTTDNPDFPQEAYQMLKWSLLDECATEWGCSQVVAATAAGKAKVFRDEFFDWMQEEASVYFTPSERKR